MPAFVKLGGAVVAAVALVAVGLFAGYRFGSETLSTGVSAADMVKVGARMKLSTAYTGARVNPIWLPNGDSFVYNAGDNEKVDFKLVDPRTGDAERFIQKGALEKALSDVFGKSVSEATIPFSKFEFIDQGVIAFTYNDRLIRYDLEQNVASLVADVPLDVPDPLNLQVIRENFPQVWADLREQISPNYKWVLSFDERGLYLRSDSGVRKALAGPIAPHETWAMNDTHWSDDSQYLAIMKADARNVTKVPVVDWSDLKAPVTHIPYPTVSDELVTFELMIANTETGASVKAVFDKETYVIPAAWRPDGSEFICLSLSRDAGTLKVLAVSVKTGAVRTVLTDTTDTYHVFPPNFIFRGGADFHLMPDGEHFAWITDTTGFRQLSVYNLDTGQGRQLTTHDFEVAAYGGYDAASDRILYTAQSDAARPYDMHVHSVPFTGGESVRLSAAEGQHQIKVSPSGAYYIDKYSTTAHPPVVELRSSDGVLIETLSVGKRLLGADKIAPTPEHFSALAADNKTVIHGVIYKPSDFDPNKKYPIIDGIYGGAFINNVPYRYDAPVPFFGRIMAELGFVTVVVDARGTPGRGKAFKDMVYKKLGQIEIPDHVAAIKSAAQDRPWMDIDRVGIIGHSYGGYFTVRGLLQAPEFYKVGVASGVSEKDSDASSLATEAFIGVKGDGRQSFETMSNVALAPNLEGKLLLVVQTSDVNTPAHGPFKLVDALIEHRKPYDMLLLPGANHSFQGGDRRYFYERVGAYFQEHL